MIKISIIVPVYNVENYLEDCIHSFLDQTMKEIEIILVNDCSPDQSGEIMKKYQEQYPDLIKCITLPENRKQGGARNAGLQICTGEYVCFVDSDDWIHPELCSQLYHKAIITESDIVFCDHIRVDVERKRELYISEIFDWQTGDLDTEKKRQLLFLEGHPWAKIIKTDLIKKNKIYFPEHIFYEDLATTPFYFLYAKRISKVNNALYYYRETIDSTTRAMDNDIHFMRSKAVELLDERLKQRGFQSKYGDEIEMLFIREFYCNSLKECFSLFSKPPIEYMTYLRKVVLEKYPHYRQNKYFSVMSDPFGAVLTLENDCSPTGLAEQILQKKIQQSQCHYDKYYKTSEDIVLNFLRDMRKQKKQIAIWGAGQKGVDFLNYFDPKQQEIKYVIDQDEKKWGKRTETGHEIVSLEQIKNMIDVILIMNKNYSQGIYQEIQKTGAELTVVNLDTYLIYHREIKLDIMEKNCCFYA